MAEGDHSLPVIQSPPPRMKRSRAGRIRALVLVGVHVLIIGHVLLWLRTGRTLSPMEPSESMEFAKDGVVNAGLVLFALALASTLLLGRWFCGWACHVVALQDACYWLMRRMGVRPKPFRSRLLLYVPFALGFYMFLWPAVYRWGVQPLSVRLHQVVSAIPELPALGPWSLRQEFVVSDFWGTFPGLLVAIPFLAICGFACVYFLGAKGFCTYGCPYGGLFAPLDQFAPGRIRVDHDSCKQTGHCTAACSSNVRVHEEVAAYGMVTDPGCMKCLDCVSVCPNEALRFGFGRPASGAAVRDGAGPVSRPRPDLTLPEEIGCLAFFLASFLAVRGLYDLVPMLMAAGVAGCVTFVAWKGWRLLRDRNVAFHRARLKVAGRLTAAGRLALVVVALTLAFVSHSGAMQLLERGAQRAADRVDWPRSAIYGASPQLMPGPMQADARLAIARSHRLRPLWEGGLALAPWPGVDRRLGWLHAWLHDWEGAETAFRRHLARFGPDDFVSHDLVLLAERRQAEDEGLAYAREVLAAHPDHVETLQLVTRMLQYQGRAQEALALVDDTLEGFEARSARRGPRHREADAATRLALRRVRSLALLEAGDLEEGVAEIRRTIEIDPDNAAAHMVLGESLAQLGRHAEAADAYERAWTLAPSADTAARLVQALEAAGRVMEADRWRREAATLEGAAGPVGSGGAGPVFGPRPAPGG